MTINLLIPILRQILQVIGGMLVARGLLDSGASDAFVGVGMNAVTLVWWLYDRWRINKQNAAVKDLAKDAAGPAAVRDAVKNA
jgi:hypothetical protein